MHPLLRVSLADDLAPFSLALHRAGIAHRVFEESGEQVLALADPEAREPSLKLYEAWRSGATILEDPTTLSPQQRGSVLWRQAPLMLGLVLLAGFVYLLTGGGDLRYETTRALLIVDWSRPGDSLGAALGRGEFWRPLAPALLHFGVLHLVFNSVVVWELGRRLELRLGALRTAALLLLLMLASNLPQFYFGSGAPFGGLSGVGYGLLGFVLIAARRAPSVGHWQVHRGFAGGLLIFLVLFSTGVSDLFGLPVANLAHWGGFLAGGALALIVVRREQSA